MFGDEKSVDEKNIEKDFRENPLELEYECLKHYYTFILKNNRPNKEAPLKCGIIMVEETRKASLKGWIV